METTDLELLQKLSLFKGLTPEHLAVAGKLLQWAHVPAGQALTVRRAPAAAVYILAEGWLKICTKDAAERPAILGIRGPGEIIGEMSVIESAPRSATVVTLTECRVAFLERLDFWSSLWELPSISYNLAVQLIHRTRQLSAAVADLSSLHLPARLGQRLANLVAEFGVEATPQGTKQLPFALSLSDLAILAGGETEAVREMLSQWHTEGLVGAKKLDDGRLQLHFCNPAALWNL